MSEHYVYGHFTLSDDIFYVGKGKGERASCVDGRNPHWNNIAKKHGIYQVVLFDNLTNDEAIEIEHALIITLGRLDLGTGPLANKTDGKEGVLNYVVTEECREKISKGNILRYSNPLEREKTRDKSIKAWSDLDKRRKQSKYLTGVFNRPEIIENRRRITTDMYKNKPEAREKTSQALKKFYSTPEGKAVRSKQMKDLWADPEYKKQRLANRAKKRAERKLMGGTDG